MDFYNHNIVSLLYAFKYSYKQTKKI
jgi:hypothetical protein